MFLPTCASAEDIARATAAGVAAPEEGGAVPGASPPATCPAPLGGEYTWNLKTACARLEKGDPLYARWRGGDLYYDGRMEMAHLDGTFDILYNDGDFESKVQATFIMCQVHPIRG
eukprot:g4905.t1